MALAVRTHFGVVNYILERLGLPGPGWLASTKWALPAMMVVGIWKQIGFAMVIFLAGLQTIPRDIVEAARIDGATGWQVFSRITLPLLNPTVVFVAVMMVINALRVFTIPYVMSAGGFTYGPGGPRQHQGVRSPSTTWVLGASNWVMLRQCLR